MARTKRDALRTLEMVVGAIVTLMVLLVTAVVLAALAGQSSVPGFNAEVCVSATPGQGVAFAGEESDLTTFGPVGLDDEATWRPERIQICEPEPSAGTAALGGVGLVVWAGAPMLFFALLWRLVRRARREGAFAGSIPGGLRQLGGLLLVWAAVDLVVTGFVNGALLTRMSDQVVFFSSDGVPWLLVLLGIAFLALERVMADAVVLREDSEATI